ncbi:MAG: NUDIX domain-containing protein [Candidatus Sumerlaeaceae bacterium]|nr:NUDIX domain-containing protein [Candidatus Sumerlaeaceae bacterium]
MMTDARDAKGADETQPLGYDLSVKVLIRDAQGQYLLLRRSPASRGNPGKWDFPGGKIDPGEGFDEAIRREVLEETGLAILLERVAGWAESVAPMRRVAYLIMEGFPAGGKLRIGPEHDAYEWVPRAELASRDLCRQFRDFAVAFAAGKSHPGGSGSVRGGASPGRHD